MKTPGDEGYKRADLLEFPSWAVVRQTAFTQLFYANRQSGSGAQVKALRIRIASMPSSNAKKTAHTTLQFSLPKKH
jgi:hypothetical protein